VNARDGGMRTTIRIPFHIHETAGCFDGAQRSLPFIFPHTAPNAPVKLPILQVLLRNRFFADYDQVSGVTLLRRLREIERNGEDGITITFLWAMAQAASTKVRMPVLRRKSG